MDLNCTILKVSVALNRNISLSLTIAKDKSYEMNVAVIYTASITVMLTHCRLMTTYGDIDLD